jgi:hypothetical protein
VFHLLQAILGVQANAPAQRLYVDPDLPPWLPDVTLRGVRVGDARVDLRFWRDSGTNHWDARVSQGTVTVEHKPWQPWLMPSTQDIGSADPRT